MAEVTVAGPGILRELWAAWEAIEAAEEALRAQRRAFRFAVDAAYATMTRETAHWLYWDTTIPVADLANALRVAEWRLGSLLQPGPPIPCHRCGRDFLAPTRTALHASNNGKVHSRPICDACRAARNRGGR